MITMQELHTYNKLVLKGVAPEFVCPIDEDHGHMTPWENNDDPCYWCLGCDAKYYFGLKQIELIKSLLRH